MTSFKFIGCFLLAITLFACHGSKNDFSYKYVFTGVSLENASSLTEFPQASNLDSISNDAYAIQVILNHEILAEGHGIADWDHPPQNQNHFDSLVITSNNDLTPDFPAGSNLNSKFMYLNSNYFNLEKADDASLSEGYNNYEKAITDTIHFLLFDPNSSPVQHVFRIDFYFHDGLILSDSTNQIKLF